MLKIMFNSILIFNSQRTFTHPHSSHLPQIDVPKELVQHQFLNRWIPLLIIKDKIQDINHARIPFQVQLQVSFSWMHLGQFISCAHLKQQMTKTNHIDVIQFIRCLGPHYCIHSRIQSKEAVFNSGQSVIEDKSSK